MATRKKKRKSLRDDPEVKSMTALLMAGRAAERADIMEEINRRDLDLSGMRGLMVEGEQEALSKLMSWLRERDERLHGKKG